MSLLNNAVETPLYGIRLECCDSGMAGKLDTATVGGVEIPAEERTPLVEALLRVIDMQQRRIERLEAEIQRLKGVPEKPKRPPRPSPLNDSSGPPSAAGGKKKRQSPDGKRRSVSPPGETTTSVNQRAPLCGLPASARAERLRAAEV